MMRGPGFVIGLAVSLLIVEVHGQPTAARPPIIDMHMHAMPVDFYGKPPAKMCAPQNFPWVDPKDSTLRECPQLVDDPCAAQIYYKGAVPRRLRRDLHCKSPRRYRGK